VRSDTDEDDDPLLEYPLEAVVHRGSNERSLQPQGPIEPPPEPRRTPAVTAPLAANLAVVPVAAAPVVSVPVVAATPAHPRGRPVWLLAALGGAIVGALTMWLFGVQPAGTVVTPGQPGAVVVVERESVPMPTPPPVLAPILTSVPAPALIVTPPSRPLLRLRRAVSTPAPSTPTARRADVVASGVVPAVAGVGLVEDAAATPSPRRQARGFRGSLSFQSEPSGARVLLNGEHVGFTPLVVDNLAVGSRAVRIEVDGAQWSGSVRVVANRKTEVTAHLIAAP
jgi:hypothetical protein